LFYLADHRFIALAWPLAGAPAAAGKRPGAVPDASGCCFETTAPSRILPGPAFTLPILSALWHTGSQLLDRTEKVPMAGANGCFLANFIR
jgi:hypothetical protein